MGWVRGLSGLVLTIGIVAGVWGVLYTVNGMTQAPATVTVPVTLAVPSDGSRAHVAVEVPGVTVPEGWFAGATPQGGRVSAGTGGPDGDLMLAAWGSTRAEQALARGSWLVGGLGALVGALALAPVLGSIAAGRPFAPGNARRLVVLAATIAVAGVLAPLLPQVAGALVLARTGLAGPRFAGPSLHVEPLLVAALVLAVAAAFRAGERLTDDVAGLV